MSREPKTLQEAIQYFADPSNCRTYLVARRWPKGVTCPRCGSKDVLFLEKYNRWHCRAKHEAPQFTLKTGTRHGGFVHQPEQMASSLLPVGQFKERNQFIRTPPCFRNHSKDCMVHASSDSPCDGHESRFQEGRRS